MINVWFHFFISGSKLGFTISIPSSSLSTPLTTLTSQNGLSGTSTSSLKSFTTSKASSTESSSVSTAVDQDIKLALMVNNDPTSGSVQDVDENYDDCWWYNENLIILHLKKIPRNINSNN